MVKTFGLNWNGQNYNEMRIYKRNETCYDEKNKNAI